MGLRAPRALPPALALGQEARLEGGGSRLEHTAMIHRGVEEARTFLAMIIFNFSIFLFVLRYFNIHNIITYIKDTDLKVLY